MTTKIRITRCIILEDMKRLKNESIRLGLKDMSSFKSFTKKKKSNRCYSMK